MLTVYCPGVWDLLHVGHLNFLERASLLGGELIVGVASDDVVQEDKGERPVVPACDRARMLGSLACVSRAVVYHRLEFLTHLEFYRPDVLAVGEDWGRAERHEAAERWAKDNGAVLFKLPYTEGISTTEIKNRIKHP